MVTILKGHLLTRVQFYHKEPSEVSNARTGSWTAHRESFEWRPYHSELNAYRRLSERGLCESGIVPRFLGHLDEFDVRRWPRQLRHFHRNHFAPSAIFLQHVPDFEKLTFETYTKGRLRNFLKHLTAIHEAGVLHNDPAPRNMMIFPCKIRKVMWLDFDRAQTWDPSNLTDLQHKELATEKKMMRRFSVDLVSKA